MKKNKKMSTSLDSFFNLVLNKVYFVKIIFIIRRREMRFLQVVKFP